MVRIGGSCFRLDTFAHKLLKSGLNNKDIYHLSYKKPVLERLLRLRNSGCCGSNEIPFVFPLHHPQPIAGFSLELAFLMAPRGLPQIQLSHEENTFKKERLPVVIFYETKEA